MKYFTAVLFMTSLLIATPALADDDDRKRWHGKRDGHHNVWKHHREHRRHRDYHDSRRYRDDKYAHERRLQRERVRLERERIRLERERIKHERHRRHRRYSDDYRYGRYYPNHRYHHKKRYRSHDYIYSSRHLHNRGKYLLGGVILGAVLNELSHAHHYKKSYKKTVTDIHNNAVIEKGCYEAVYSDDGNRELIPIHPDNCKRY